MWRRIQIVLNQRQGGMCICGVFSVNYFLPAGYPSPKAVGAIFSRSQVHIRRMLLEGSPVIVAMRPHERPSRRRICCISSARFRLTPLAPAEVLAGGFDPLQPRQRSFPDQVALHLREDDGQVQHRPPHALSWSMDSRRLMISTSFSRGHPSSSKTSVSRPTQAVQRRDLQAVPRLEGGPQAVQPGPVPRGPAAHVLEDLLAVGQHPALGLRVVGVGVAGHRHTGVSIGFPALLSLAPRFWHGGMMLRWAEFWLC